MISLRHLNKLIKITFFLWLLIFNQILANSANTPADIWETNEENKKKDNQINNKTIESPIVSDNENKIQIDEQQIDKFDQSVIGIFDPSQNNLTLDMWISSDGKDIKKILKRINTLKLSKLSENLLFQVLFTNAYPPKKNLTSEEFLKIKIDWLIKNKRIKDLETLLKNNSEVGESAKAIKFLIDEHLSSADIKSACGKVSFISKGVKNDYLDKFKIFCLINDGRTDEAQLILDLAKERGMKDKFYEDKINFLLGVSEKTNPKIIDNNLINFFLSHITSKNFNYEPTEKTNTYIWRYLSASNLIKIDNLENESIITTYEKAAAEESLNTQEVFNMYKKILFNVNQLLNASELYKNLPNYKARALIYQSILLSDNIEKKLYLSFLLKDLFIKDKLLNVYSIELSNILKNMDTTKIPENYSELFEQNLDPEFKNVKKIKFDNTILHRSKVIKHFLNNNEKPKKIEKDLKTVYKKIKKNKKYFISINDIIVLESLVADGIKIPKDLDLLELTSQLTVPISLEDLVSKKQIGLVMLKIVEIIGEDDVVNLDPETIYFLNRILNKLDLKKIRNSILREVLPARA